VGFSCLHFALVDAPILHGAGAEGNFLC
jgi:hypothetical protein